MTRDRSISQVGRTTSPRSRWLHAGPVILLAATLFVGGVNAGGCSTTVPIPGPGTTTTSTTDAVARPVILPSDHVLGDSAATLTIVQYESYPSTACGRFARSEFPAIKEQYIDTGKVRWVFRYFPLASQARAEPAAKAAECAADQDKFIEYRDLIYANPDSSGNVVLTDAQLEAHADTLSLDRTVFDPCFTGDSKTSRIDEDVNSGTALGVNSVPAFVVDEQLTQGFITAADLSKIIDRHLAGSP
jgi:protein-disulfide isomerase